MAEIMIPTGRLVGGDLYKLVQRKDDVTKQPKFKKDGVTPDSAVNFGVAIPKAGETHWSQTAWGAQIFQEGAKAYPREHQAPSFAWKITDGDSAIPNKKGNIPNQQEGYPGHWVLWFSQGWAPKTVNADGSVELPEGAIKCGYYVRVFASVKGNAPSPSPGVYLNPLAVALMGEGDIIEAAGSVDTSVFATQPAGALPPGARPVTAAAPQFSAPPAYTPPAGVAGTPPAYTPPVNAPAPNPAFTNIPAPPPAAPARVMTAKAAGATYESFIAQGWTDALLVQHGYMAP